VRLAAKLTGWRIDIKSEEEKRREVEAQLEGLEMPGEDGEPGEDEAPAPVLVLPDIHDEVVASLRDAGYESAEMVAAASIEALIEVPGIDEATAESVLAAAQAEVEAAAARAQGDIDAGDAAPVEAAGDTEEAGDAPAEDVQDSQPE